MSTAVLDLINAVKTFDDVYPGEEKEEEEEEGEEEGEEGEEEEDGVEETENMAANIVKVAKNSVNGTLSFIPRPDH